MRPVATCASKGRCGSQEARAHAGRKEVRRDASSGRQARRQEGRQAGRQQTGRQVSKLSQRIAASACPGVPTRRRVKLPGRTCPRAVGRQAPRRKEVTSSQAGTRTAVRADIRAHGHRAARNGPTWHTSAHLGTQSAQNRYTSAHNVYTRSVRIDALRHRSECVRTHGAHWHTHTHPPAQRPHRHTLEHIGTQSMRDQHGVHASAHARGKQEATEVGGRKRADQLLPGASPRSHRSTNQRGI